MKNAEEGTELGYQSVDESVASCSVFPSARTLPLKKRTRQTKAPIGCNGKQLEELKCEFCHKVCFSNNELEEHMKIRHSNKKCTCNECGKGFANKSSLLRHFKIHEGLFPIKCALCPRTFRDRAGLADHTRTHSSEKPFKCNKCPATFRYRRNMQEHHLGTHINEKSRYECPVKCGRSFATRQSLRRHVKIHLNAMKEYECAYCEKEYSVKGSLRRHILSKHPNECLSKSQFASDTTAPKTEVRSAASEFSTSSPIVPGPVEAILQTKKSGSNEFRSLVPVIPSLKINTGKTERELEPAEIGENKALEELECKFCTKVCFSNDELEDHMEIRHGNNKYTCNVSGKGLPRKSYLREHMRIHEGVSPYQCTLCPKVFRTRAHITSHLRIHNSEKPFKCNKCPSTFRRKGNIQQHQLTHTNEKRYECPVKCGRSFTTRSNLMRHAKIHLNEVRTYLCAYCNKEWLRKDTLQRHIFSRHANESPPGSQFASDTTATKTEVRSAASEFSKLSPIFPGPVEMRLEELECEFCNRVCLSNNELEEHMKIRHSNMKYTCHECGKGFIRKSNLPRHLRIHENVFPYQCAFCPKAYRERRDITEHLYIHNDEKPFKCDKCPAIFSRKRNLQRHLSTHIMNEKPRYECPAKCGRSFTTRQSLRRHAKMHSITVKKYECVYCKKECLQKYNLQRHIFARHLNESPPESEFASDTTAPKTEVRRAASEFSTLSPLVPGTFEETIECSFQPFAVKLEDTPRYGLEPIENVKWETIKCTLEPVAVKEEQKAIGCILKLDDIKMEVETEQFVEIKPECIKKEM